MDLLSPQESHAFQAFLSSMDYTDLSPTEWALLNGPNQPDDGDIFPRSSQALAKATKDLMSGRWDSFSQQLQESNPNQAHLQHSNDYGSHRSRCETFPFLNPKSHLQQPALSLSPHTHDFRSQLASSSETSTTTTPASPHPPFNFPDQTLSHIQLPQAQLHQSLSRHRRASSPTAKRSSVTHTVKRRKPSPSTTPSVASLAKQSLLSPSQKKANHIQSEQKRRANIRRGYEALCDTVPALRDAIREEEEGEVRMSQLESGSSGKSSRSKRKRRDGGGDGDKMDGRAGPRSENVVLSKSMFYPYSSTREVWFADWGFFSHRIHS